MEKKNSRMIPSFSLGNLGDKDGVTTKQDREFNSFKRD